MAVAVLGALGLHAWFGGSMAGLHERSAALASSAAAPTALDGFAERFYWENPAGLLIGQVGE